MQDPPFICTLAIETERAKFERRTRKAVPRWRVRRPSTRLGDPRPGRKGWRKATGTAVRPRSPGILCRPTMAEDTVNPQRSAVRAPALPQSHTIVHPVVVEGAMRR